MKQGRIFIITNKAVYNFKKKEIKRRIEIGKVRGITITKSTDEIVMHGHDIEYDYHYVSSKRLTIIELLALTYYQETNEELPLILVNEKSLKNYVTKKDEKKKNIKFTKMPQSEQIKIKDYLSNFNKAYRRRSTIINKVYCSPDSNNKNSNSVKFEDFQLISVLGRGSFGKVYLAEYRYTGDLFAIKSLKKETIINEEQIDNARLEKKIYETINSPFLCSLSFCFQTEDRIYFVMNYIPGGELFTHLRRIKKFDEETVVFYAAQIGIAIQYLHDKGIIYRDLKPENILIDCDGYLKLTDFGISKFLQENQKAQSFCGTPEYVAPEVILNEENNEGYDMMADWWSYGILM